MKKIKTSVYLFPAALAVVFMSSILIILSPVGHKTLIPIPTPTPSPSNIQPTPSFCAGFAGIKCPPNYRCKLENKYPDAGGVCVKK